MIIDSHHHFWNYTPEEFDWLDDSMSALRRDFSPSDLRSEMYNAGVDGVVSVQARTSLEETRWLLELAGNHDFIRGVVGWLPMESGAESLTASLNELAADPKLCGVREVMQGRAPGALLDTAFNSGVARLMEHDLAYDILIHENQLEEATIFVDRHPGQIFVLDHIAKPKIRDGSISLWATRLRKIARRQNVFCKLSGLVTEADPQQWQVKELQPYFDLALEAFTPKRLMFGSDWPVCLLGCSYDQWAQIVRTWASELSESEQSDFFGGTALRAYQLTNP